MMDVYCIISYYHHGTSAAKEASHRLPNEFIEFFWVGQNFPINSADLESGENRTAILERLLHRREVEGIESYQTADHWQFVG